MHLFDVYISMFCNEVEQLLKRGLRSDYIRNEDNLNFLKGKLLFKDNIRYNLTNKAKFFVSYDEYSQNRPENKLIKTTLEYLTNKTSNFSLQQHIRQLVFAMEEIKPSANIKADFNKCKCNRLMKDYSNIIMWCRLFLTNESFVSFKGSSIAFAILFDMNRVFEDYVAHCLRKNEQYKNNVINVQHSGHSLIEFPNSLFNLKPDIVIFEEDRVYEILDTKWKRIEEFKNISQSDIYQMYAYVTKYKEADKVSLVYPKISDSTGFKKKHCFNKDGEAKHLEIKFFDLDNNELVD